MSRPVLYPYQQRWLADRSRYKVARFARQTGKTFTTTLELVLDCLEAEAERRPTRWVYLSAGERQGREAMNEGVRLHLDAMGAAYKVVERDLTIDNSRVTALDAEFPRGSKLSILPANPRTARGFSANVVLDEFAHHQDSREIWKALYPVISAGYKLRVVSTPNGKGNKFYELCTDPALGKRWSRHLVTIHDAIRDGLPRDAVELEEALGDPVAWRQEFLCEFVDEATAWIPFPTIDAAEHEQAGVPELYQSGRTFVGMDIARRRHLTIIGVLELVGELLWTRALIELQNAPFRQQLDTLAEVFRTYRVARARLDQTGLGEMMVETAQERHGSRVDGVLFSPANKLDLATALRDTMDDRRLRIPHNHVLRADLHSVQRVPSPSGGAPRLVADETDTGHADRFWALALAAHAAREPRREYGYQAARPMRARHPGEDPDEDPLRVGCRGWYRGVA